jgi:hypothetical protein
LAVAVDRAVRKRKRASLALQDLSVDVSEKEFGSLLGISNLAQTLKEIPSDFEANFLRGSGVVRPYDRNAAPALPFLSAQPPERPRPQKPLRGRW